MEIYILVLIGYIIGNFNTAHYVGKFKNINIREVGSKNPGASNITMKLGWKYGILTGVADILKAFIPVFILKLLNYNDIELLLVGLAVIIGHIYPIVHKFKGGKGTASFIGLAFALHPLLGLVMGLTIVIVTFLTDYIALGTIVMVILFSVINYFYYDMIFFLVSLIVPVVSIWRHRENIENIINKKEHGLRATLKK